MLNQTAQSYWRRHNGQNHLPKVIEGIKFIDGIREDKVAA